MCCSVNSSGPVNRIIFKFSFACFCIALTLLLAAVTMWSNRGRHLMVRARLRAPQYIKIKLNKGMNKICACCWINKGFGSINKKESEESDKREPAHASIASAFSSWWKAKVCGLTDSPLCLYRFLPFNLPLPFIYIYIYIFSRKLCGHISLEEHIFS